MDFVKIKVPNGRPIPCSRVDLFIFEKQIPEDTQQGFAKFKIQNPKFFILSNKFSPFSYSIL